MSSDVDAASEEQLQQQQHKQQRPRSRGKSALSSHSVLPAIGEVDEPEPEQAGVVAATLEAVDNPSLAASLVVGTTPRSSESAGSDKSTITEQDGSAQLADDSISKDETVFESVTDEKAEMLGYLEEHGVRRLFEEFVEIFYLTKPDDPLEAMIARLNVVSDHDRF